MLRAPKLQKRAARVGFEWHDVKGPRDKLLEELQELDEASERERLVEAGDVLFAAVNIIRRYGVDAEQALKASNAKFEKRFRCMEDVAAADGEDFANLSLDGQETYWQRAKKAVG